MEDLGFVMVVVGVYVYENKICVNCGFFIDVENFKFEFVMLEVLEILKDNNFIFDVVMLEELEFIYVKGLNLSVLIFFLGDDSIIEY